MNDIEPTDLEIAISSADATEDRTTAVLLAEYRKVHRALDRLVRRGCDSAPGSFGQTKLDWIRRMYGVPAKIGMRIRYGNSRDDAQDGTITGARDGRLLIRLDGWPRRRRPLAFHPTWNIHYPPANASVMARPDGGSNT